MEDQSARRLPPRRREDLDPGGQRLWDAILSSRGGVLGDRADDLLTPDGGLAGPFNAFVRAPGVGARVSGLGWALRSETSLERRVTEVAIITTGARWQAEFEWWAHAAMAREHGVPEAVVDAIATGADPPFAAADERAAYAVARELGQDGRVSAGAYAAALGQFGEAGLVELVSLCGYYTLISFLLNAFEVPVPPGAHPQWPAPD
jgi:4-carboxymuconolactone decarboxylase